MKKRLLFVFVLFFAVMQTQCMENEDSSSGENQNEVTLRQRVEDQNVDQKFDIYDEIKRDDRSILPEEVSIKDLAPFLCCPLKCFLMVTKATLSYL